MANSPILQLRNNGATVIYVFVNVHALVVDNSQEVDRVVNVDTVLDGKIQLLLRHELVEEIRFPSLTLDRVMGNLLNSDTNKAADGKWIIVVRFVDVLVPLRFCVSMKCDRISPGLLQAKSLNCAVTSTGDGS